MRCRVVSLLATASASLLMLDPTTTISGFTVFHHINNHRHAPSRRLSSLVSLMAAAETKQTRRSTVGIATADDNDEEKPAGVVGAQFFGGNKEKEEFYDPDAESEAGTEVTDSSRTYNRFADRTAFSDATVAAIAESIQVQINRVLFSDESAAAATDYTYASSVQWDTEMQVKSTSPLQELESALGFYRRLDVAIISGESKSDNTVQLRWEISVQWPAIWEPRVLLTGTSTLTVQDKQITKQLDTLDSDLLPTIQRQILPRFWDLYHIGMTPAAEVSPELNVKPGGLFWRYTIAELPPRLVLQPTLQDLGDREDSNASVLPNHAFSCVIKTMGPTKQRFTPVTGVQVQLVPVIANHGGGPRQLKLRWSIPIATEYASNPVLALPGSDPEMSDDAEPTCAYVFQPRRKVATVPYGGGPQEAAISDLRQKLYEDVVKDGLKPVLDASGRPVFFFAMDSVKACYTEEGLGMAVYEWRPHFTNPNKVGIELEL